MSKIKASERDAREWREVVCAIGQYVCDLVAPVAEGYADLPAVAHAELERVIESLDAFDRAMAKLDGKQGAVGGKYRLERVEQ